MIDERQQELAALYVLDLLQGSELGKFEAELREDGKLQQLVRELRLATLLIAQHAPQVDPPPELKERVLASFQELKPSSAPSLIFRPAVIVPWTIAAGLAICCVWLSQVFFQSRAGYFILKDETAFSQIEVSTVRNQLEAERILSNRQLSEATHELNQLNQQLERSTEKIVEATRVLSDTYDQLDGARAQLQDRDSRLRELAAQLATATSEISVLRGRLPNQGSFAQIKVARLAPPSTAAPQPAASVIWDPVAQQGLLRVDQLPKLAGDRDYQLWLTDPAYPAPVDGGVFTVNPDTGHAHVSFKPKQALNDVSQITVSLERKGGAAKAEGPLVLVGNF